MDFNEYHALAQRTAKQYPTQVANLNHAALGLATEFMECVVEYDPKKSEEELGDYCWYIPVACQALGVKLGDLMLDATGHSNANALQASVNLNQSVMKLGAKATGDLITMVKRLKIYEKELTPEMRGNALNDIVKMVSFAAQLAESVGYSLASALRNNIFKLKLRFPDAYSNEAAEGRADKEGLDARVS